MPQLRTAAACAVLLATTAVALYLGTFTGWGFVGDSAADRLVRSAAPLAVGVVVEAAGVVLCCTLNGRPWRTWWLLAAFVPVAIAAVGSL